MRNHKATCRWPLQDDQTLEGEGYTKLSLAVHQINCHQGGMLSPTPGAKIGLTPSKSIRVKACGWLAVRTSSQLSMRGRLFHMRMSTMHAYNMLHARALTW